MPARETNADPEQLALRALAWTLADPDRAGRMLAVTGIEPADLRARIGEPAVQAASLGFLEANEPDLLACADELEVRPEALVAARASLEARA